MDRAPLPACAVPAAAPIPAVAGIGLRFAHHDAVLAGQASAWLEVHPENYLDDGRDREVLAAVRERYPLSLHATGLSLGSADGLDLNHLGAFAALCAEMKPALVSDHLSWSIGGGAYLPDLLPMPYTREALAVCAANIDRVQQALGRRILIENPSVYLCFAGNEMSEPDFLARLVQSTGCGILLDINNIAVSAQNLGRDAAAELDIYLNALPAGAIGEFHLAGHALRRLENDALLAIDDHGSPVSAPVWRLFEQAVRRVGRRPTLLEWDTAIPELAVLQQQAAIADNVLDKAQPEALAHAC